MKPVLPLLFVICSIVFSCQSTESVLPIEEAETEVKTCHLFAHAVVNYREAHNGREPFYYLSLLDQNGEQFGDVYTGSIQGGVIEVGEAISINYHFEITNDISYVSACGDDEANQPSMEEMAKVVVCDMNPS